ARVRRAAARAGGDRQAVHAGQRRTGRRAPLGRCPPLKVGSGGSGRQVAGVGGQRGHRGREPLGRARVGVGLNGHVDGSRPVTEQRELELVGQLEPREQRLQLVEAVAAPREHGEAEVHLAGRALVGGNGAVPPARAPRRLARAARRARVAGRGAAQPVPVGAVRRRASASASRRSSGRVTLIRIGLPSTSATRLPRRLTRAASSVAVAPAARAASWASRSRALSKPWGVWTARRLARSSSSPDAVTTVSVTGRAAVAAPCSRAAASTRATTSAVRKGRATSWTSTVPAAVARTRACTDSWRVAPPAT